MRHRFVIDTSIYPSVTKAFKDFMASTSNEDVVIEITTFGGSVFAARDIVNIIKKYPGKVHAEIGTYVMSAGTYITAAIKAKGGRVIMSSNAQMMIHKPSLESEGTADKIASDLKMLQDITTEYYNTYMAVTGKSLDELNAMLTEDCWLTAGEALALGLITSIGEPSVITPEVVAQLKSYGREVVATETKQHLKKEDMKFPLVIAALRLNEDATEQEVVKAISALNKENATATADLKTAQDAKAALEVKVAELEGSIEADKKAKVTALVNAAVKDNKIMEAQKEQFTKLATADYESTAEVIASMQPYKSVAAGAGADNTVEKDYTVEDYKNMHKNGALAKFAKESPEAFAKLKTEYLESIKRD